jgi:general secretion pathway protein I
MYNAHYKSNKGLTLIEVLVALVIISTALIAAQRTIGNTINNYARLQQNVIASIVAKNALIELILNQHITPTRYVCQKGLPFECQMVSRLTPNRYLLSVEILIYTDKQVQNPIERLYTLVPQG